MIRLEKEIKDEIVSLLKKAKIVRETFTGKVIINLNQSGVTDIVSEKTERFN